MTSSTANWSNLLSHAAVSDVGMRRANNQDSFAVVMADDESDWQSRGHLLLVADGMGAHAAGELASKLAADGIPLRYQKHKELSPPDALRQAVIESNTEIHERGSANLEFQGMGTTCSALLILPQGAIAAHVGDSRIYRFRGERLEQMTFDHSLVWEMRAAGQFTGDDTSHLPKNVITRSLGPNPQVQVDLEGPFPLELGDTFLLCSDGLTGHVEDLEIGILLGALDVDEAAQFLVDLANLRGGSDNVTVIVSKVVAKDVGSAAAPPLTTGHRQQNTNPMMLATLWTAAAIAAAVAAGAAISGAYLAAAIAAALSLVSALVGLVMRGAPETGRPLAPGQLGRGPYVSCMCQPTAEFVSELGTTVDQLQTAAKEENWAVQWNRFDALRSDAGRSADAGENQQAVRQFARSIMFVMHELRNQPKAST
jgi:protein phosphatase